jgi:methylase of polypeptide subunit release factors
MSETDDKHELSFPPGTVMPLHVLAPFGPHTSGCERMLRLGEVTSKDTVYDLGCGDGRIIIADRD